MRSFSLSLLLCLLSVTAVAQEQEKAPAADGKSSKTYVCPAGQPCNVTIRVKADCKKCKKPVARVVRKGLEFALRGSGSWGKIPGQGGTDDFLAGNGELVLQLPTFFGSELGLEFAMGGGGGLYPNQSTVLYGMTEFGVLWSPSRFQAMLGYSAELGTTDDESVLNRHLGVLHLRYFFTDRWAVDIAGKLGWGGQAWDEVVSYQKEKDGEPWWWEDTITKHYEGMSGGVTAGLQWTW